MRWPFLVLVVSVFAGFVLALAPAAPAHAAPPPCDWRVEYTRTLAESHEDITLWSVAPPAPGLWGQIVDEHALVAPNLPCEFVADVVRHEHMHLQQVRQYGSGEFAGKMLGDRLEITADCASMLAGSRYHPYVDHAGGCSPRDLADARQLLYPR